MFSRIGGARSLARTALLHLALANSFWAGPPLYSAGTESAGALSVDDLISGLAKRKTEVTSFDNTTFSTLVTEPLKTRGFLKFTPRSRLERHEQQLIAIDDVAFFVGVRDESKRKRGDKTLSLDEYPALRIFVEALRSTFVRDSTTLKRLYHATAEGELRHRTLMLQHFDQASQTLVKSVRVSGEGHRITTVETRAPEGDRSILVVTKVVP